jgi:uncharacterized membrane protein
MQQRVQLKSKINVGEGERLVSGIAGAALLWMAISRRSLASIPFALGSGYLLYRGMSGRDIIYEKLEINRAGEEGRMGIRAERTLTIHRPRAEVYRFWRQLDNLPRFMEHLKSVELLDPEGKRSHWTAKGPLDTDIDWEAEITEERENELISWRSLPGAEVDNRGSVRFMEAPGGRGTEVHIRMTYDPPGGSAGAAIAKLFGEEPYQQIREDIRRFKQIMEAGETATTFGQTSGRLEEVEQQRTEIQRRKQKDVVQKASEDSFPASDAPGWTGGSS